MCNGVTESDLRAIAEREKEHVWSAIYDEVCNCCEKCSEDVRQIVNDEIKNPQLPAGSSSD